MTILPPDKCVLPGYTFNDLGNRAHSELNSGHSPAHHGATVSPCQTPVEFRFPGPGDIQSQRAVSLRRSGYAFLPGPLRCRKTPPPPLPKAWRCTARA